MLHASNGNWTSHWHYSIKYSWNLSSNKQNKPNPYFNDIFHGKGKDSDLNHEIIAQTFRQLLGAGMQVNLTKSKLCTIEQEFLCFFAETERVQPNEKWSKALHMLMYNTISKDQSIDTINFIIKPILKRGERLAWTTPLMKDNKPFIIERGRNRRHSSKWKQQLPVQLYAPIPIQKTFDN